MRRAIALLVLLGACTSPDTVPSPSKAPPAPAGAIRFGYPEEPPTLNPMARSGGSAATRDILRPVLPALFRLDEKLKPQPDLVARFPKPSEIQSSPFSVTLTLKSRKWSDGRPITSADLVFTLDTMRGGPTAGRYRHLTKVETFQNARRFRLVFDRPVRRWWALFSIDDMILPAHAFGDGWENGPTVSGGPFRFAGWTRGLSIQLKRNDSFEGRKSAAEAIEILFVPSEEMRLQLTDRGSLDVSYAIGESNFTARTKARGIEPVSRWAQAWWELAVVPGRVPIQLAQAIVMSLDRNLAVELLELDGQVTSGLPAKFPSDDLSGPWDRFTGDIEAARSLLIKSGYSLSDTGLELRGKPVSFTLVVGDGSSTAGGLARWIHFRLRGIGLRTELIPIDSGRLERDWLTESRADATLTIRRASDAPDASAFAFSPHPAGRVAGIESLVDDAERGQAGARVLTGLDPAAWRRLQDRVAASYTLDPLVRVKEMLFSSSVGGLSLTATLAGPLAEAYLWDLHAA